MFVFHFTNFVGSLDIQAPTHDGIKARSPVIIFYQEKEDLTRHEILKRFNRLLNENEVSFIRPVKELTNEWVINLQELRHQFECLEDSKFLKGKFTIEPEFVKRENRDVITDELLGEETQLKFSIYPEDVEIQANYSGDLPPEELTSSLKKFQKHNPSNKRTGFLMMKFEDSPVQTQLINVVKNHFATHEIKILRADDTWYANELLPNIRTYMHGCNFGVALFDRINSQDFNPNVSLEIGYMMALDKPVLLLKEKSMKSLPTDLVSKLYHEYDFQNPEITLQLAIDKWLRDQEYI